MSKFLSDFLHNYFFMYKTSKSKKSNTFKTKNKN